MDPIDRFNYLDHILQRDTERLRASSETSVAEMLAVVAGMIQCPLPPTVVISKYIQMLSEFPQDLLEISMNHVMKTHKWNNFPKLAEFVEVMQPTLNERQQDLRSTKDTIRWYKEGPIRRVGARPPAGGKGPRPLTGLLPKITQQKGD